MAEQDSNTPPPAPPKAHPQAKDASAKASPHAHAKAIGAHKQRQIGKGELAVTSLNGQAVDLSVYSWQHNAAAALHGWAEHEHHEAKPVDLSLDDYKKALLAASAPVVRAAVDVDTNVTALSSFKAGEKDDKGDDKKPAKIRVTAKKGEVLDLRKLGLDTYDLANAGVPFTAAEEPHAPALSKHAAHVKNAEAAQRAAAAPAADNDSHLFAKA